MAGFLILAFLLFRIIFHKAPRKMFLILWAVVALRLVCPLGFSNPLGLLPANRIISETGNEARPYEIESAYKEELFPRGEGRPEDTPAQAADSKRLHVFLNVGSWIWLGGLLLFVIYWLWTEKQTRRAVSVFEELSPGVRQVDGISSPFVRGVISPLIYLPPSLAEEDIPAVLAHEKTHIRRLDTLWKQLGYWLLAFNWFHPLFWLAYALFNRDLETACDEACFGGMSPDEQKQYLIALFHVATGGNKRTGMLAFGEAGIKERILHLTKYRPAKRGFRIVSALAALLLAFFLFAAPGRFMSPPPVRYPRVYDKTCIFTNKYSIRSAAENSDCVVRVVVEDWLGDAPAGNRTYFNARVIDCFCGDCPERIRLIQYGSTAGVSYPYPLYTAGNELVLFLIKEAPNQDKGIGENAYSSLADFYTTLYVVEYQKDIFLLNIWPCMFRETEGEAADDYASEELRKALIRSDSIWERVWNEMDESDDARGFCAFRLSELIQLLGGS